MPSLKSIGGLSREWKLLLACARTALDAGRAARVREWIAQGLDWEALLASAERHGLMALLWTHLQAAAQGQLPAATAERLQKRFREIQAWNLRLAGALHRVLELLSSNSVAAVTYKGPALAEQLYGNMALRTFADLDLLVAHADMPRVREMLHADGYVLDGGAESPRASAEGLPRTAGQFAFHDREGTLLLEFHTECTLRHFPRPLDAKWLVDDPQMVTVAGREVPTLRPAKLLVALCVHGAKDYWNQLKWVCDVGEFLRVHADLDWPAAFDEARRLGCLRMVLLGVVLARDLLEAPLPAPVASELARDPGVTALTALPRRMLLNQYEPGAPRRFFFRVGMCAGRMEGLRYALRLATTPAEEDWPAASGPAGFSPLHAVLRPFRLLRKYGLRG